MLFIRNMAAPELAVAAEHFGEGFTAGRAPVSEYGNNSDMLGDKSVSDYPIIDCFAICLCVNIRKVRNSQISA